MKISVEQNDMRITIEVNGDDQNMHEMLEHFKSVLLALTYQENSWRDAIQELAEQYQYEWEMDNDDIDNLSEELSDPIHVRSEHC